MSISSNSLYGPQRVIEAVRQFFLAEQIPYGLALVRITLPLVLFYDLLDHWVFARELYSADGATAPIWVTYGFKSPFPEAPGAIAVALFTILLGSLLTASVGWMTRTSLLIAGVLYWYFTALDAVSTLTKYTVIANHILLLLAISHCGKIWSLDALRRPTVGPVYAIWPQRLIQLLVATVYLGAAMTKIHTATYFSGEQLMWWMYSHVNGHHLFGEYLANKPVLLSLGAYATIIWEVLFVVTCWKGFQKNLMLFIGVGFHIGTYLTLGLDIFPLVMFAIYFAFLTDREVLHIIRWCKALAQRLRLPQVDWTHVVRALMPVSRKLGPVAFGLFVWCVGLGGAGLERVIDPYQQHGNDGPSPLQTIDAASVNRMLAGPEPLRLKDMVFSLELGTNHFAGSLIGRKSSFEIGEELIAQCVTTPLHPDLYVECNLHSEDGRIIQRQKVILTRDSNRANFTYALGNALVPGDYEMRLNFSGREVASRSFTITAP